MSNKRPPPKEEVRDRGIPSAAAEALPFQCSSVVVRCPAATPRANGTRWCSTSSRPDAADAQALKRARSPAADRSQD